jgi:Protein of unknown function (DUF1579)
MMSFSEQKIRSTLLIAYLIAICIICSACATNGGQGTISPTIPRTVSAQPTSVPSADSQQTASLRLAKPGLPLKKLQLLVGTWQTHMMVRQTQGSTPVVSTNITTRRQWVNNDTYLQEEMTGQLPGAPYYRLGFLTYNNLEQQYELVTMDHLDTGMMLYQSVGSVDSGNTVTLYGRFTEGGSGPTVVGQVIKIRYVFRWENSETNSEEMYFTRPASPEYLAVQYLFTRQK